MTTELFRGKSVTHGEQRYDTIGDWWPVRGRIEVRVSRCGDRRTDMLVAIHELVEAFLCEQAGVTDEQVCMHDVKFGKEPHDQDAEPGEDQRAPYRRQHLVAEIVERLLCDEVGMTWTQHSVNARRASEVLLGGAD